MKKLSIIIPTYNRAGYIEEAINSVLEQDYFLENPLAETCDFLVVDDGSQDGTREIVKQFAPAVGYQYQDNKGASAARNLGLSKTKSEFVAFLDSDDLWKKEKLSVQMAFMQTNTEAKMCCTGETWIRNGVFVNPRKKHQKYSGWIFDKVLPLCLLSLSSALFRRSLFTDIGNFDEGLPVCEDYDFSIRLAHKYPIHFIPQALIIKRGGHIDQLSKKYWGMDRYRIKALEKALALDLSPQQKEQVKKEIRRKSRILIQGFLKRDKGEEARFYQDISQKYNNLKGES